MENRKTLLFIYNAHSGKGMIREHLLDIVDTMTKAEYDVTIYPTQFRGDATKQIVERGKNFDRIVCSGGDGTLDEVVQGMVDSDCHTPVGYIPAGSTNDFAVSLNISKDMVTAAADAVSGSVFLCDAGSLNGKNFVYVAAFGVFANVSFETPQELKNLFGHAAYILEGAKRIWDIPSYRITVKHDDIEFTDNFILGMVTNSISVGGFKGITGNDVILDDGLFEVTLIRTPANPLELNEILFYLADPHIEFHMVYQFKTSKLELVSDTPIPWTRDGEYGRTFTRTNIDNEKQRIPIIIGGGGTWKEKSESKNKLKTLLDVVADDIEGALFE